MGLDMYLYERDKETKKDNEIGYWRKFNSLHSFIASLKDKPETNCERLWLTKKDIDFIIDTLTEVYDILEAEHPKFITSFNNKGEVEQDYDYDFEFSQEAQTKCTTLLAPTSGFFWGNIDVDMYYYTSVKNALEVFKKAKESKKKGNRIYYYSWW